MTALISAKASKKAAERLSGLGFDILTLPPFPVLPMPVSAHPDSLLFIGIDRIITHNDYYDRAKEEIEYISKISHKKICLSDEQMSDIYPYDTIFNAVHLNGKIICRRQSISKLILKYAEEHSLRIINVSQGYAKCSALVLDSSTVITADHGIHQAALTSGIESLLIESGQIGIEEYDTGFIGGTAGVCGNTVYFNGNIELHQSFNSIRDFCHAHGKEIISLSSSPLFDIGTIFFI